MEQIAADIVVIGAGPAGVTAAVTAARMGSRVALVTNRPVLGGNSSSEIRVWTRGATGAGNLFAEEMGIWGDFKMRNLYANLEGNPIFWDQVLLDACQQQSNISLFLNTCAIEVTMQENRVKSVQGWQMNSERELLFTGEIFIDATGDGMLGARAGVPFYMGKEPKSMYNEEQAPAVAKTDTQGCTLFYYVKRTEAPVKFVAPKMAYGIEHVADLVNRGGRVVKEDFGGSDYWWFEYGGKLNTIADMQSIGLELNRLAMGVWNYIKNSGKFNADCLTLEWMGSLPGKRESRRMITDYVVTQNDIMQNRKFYDGAFYGGWYMDFHPSGGIFAGDENCIQLPAGVYQMPLRCLYNSTVPNLLFAGRDIGASHAAFSSSRIMNTCALSGQAAAALAHYCTANKILADEIGQKQAAEIRQSLLRDDMFVPGFANEDPQDLARAASAEASSSFNGSCGVAAGNMQVSEAAFITFPAVPGLETVEICCSAGEGTVLQGSWHVAKLPSRNAYGPAVGGCEIPVPQGQKQWVALPLPVLEEACFLTLVLRQNRALVLHTEENQRTGFLCGHKELSVYHYPCVKGAFGGVYGAQNINNGQSRPYNQPNLWVAGGEKEPHFSLRWEQPQTIRELRLSFNPDLAKEIPSSKAAVWAEDHKFTARPGMPPELAKEFVVYAESPAGKWQQIAHRRENWQRMAIVQLPAPVQTNAVRVVFVQTYGGPAQVFEARVYGQLQGGTAWGE
ncbi:MAG: FAD-dependent oxidoreductase [Oscillospiraceae bacterium]